MGVVGSHGYDRLGEGRDGVVDGMHAGQGQGGWSHIGRCRSTSSERGKDTGNTRSHRRPNAQLYVGSSRN